jgi:hypothetical protein
MFKNDITNTAQIYNNRHYTVHMHYTTPALSLEVHDRRQPALVVVLVLSITSNTQRTEKNLVRAVRDGGTIAKHRLSKIELVVPVVAGRSARVGVTRDVVKLDELADSLHRLVRRTSRDRGRELGLGIDEVDGDTWAAEREAIHHARVGEPSEGEVGRAGLDLAVLVDGDREGNAEEVVGGVEDGLLIEGAGDAEVGHNVRVRGRGDGDPARVSREGGAVKALGRAEVGGDGGRLASADLI